jgi:hypothetical protein
MVLHETKKHLHNKRNLTRLRKKPTEREKILAEFRGSSKTKFPKY